MEDTQTLVTLLTIAVILLSVVIVALLVAVTVVLIKVHHLVKTVDAITTNVASATEWLSPTKVISTAVRLFRR